MSELDRRPGVKKANLVARTLKLAGVDEQGGNALVAELDQLFGMDNVAYDTEAGTLSFAYDATHCSVDVVEAIVNTHGARFADSWWNRTKRGYYRFVDRNMKDNAAHEPHCCNKMPRR